MFQKITGCESCHQQLPITNCNCPTPSMNDQLPFLPDPFSHFHQEPTYPYHACTDEEVSYFTNRADDNPSHLHQRCSSTDTSISTSSTSTCTSQITATHGISSTQKGKKRKRGQQEEGDRIYIRYPKPPYKYSGIIATAILNSPEKRLFLAEIQNKMAEYFTFFRGSYKGWRDSVRHTLSHHKCFVKHPVYLTKGNDVVKKYRWGVDETLLAEKMFRRHDNGFCTETMFSLYLHDELRLPPAGLPEGQPYTNIPDNAEECPKLGNRFANIRNYTEEFTPVQVSPAYADCPVVCRGPGDKECFMNLPTVRACAAPVDSPSQYQRYDISTFTPDRSRKSDDKSSITPVTYRSTPSSYPFHQNQSLDYNVYDVMSYIAHTFNQIRSPIDAVNNLGFLCSSSEPSESASPRPDVDRIPGTDYNTNYIKVENDVTLDEEQVSENCDVTPSKSDDCCTVQFLEPISPAPEQNDPYTNP